MTSIGFALSALQAILQLAPTVEEVVSIATTAISSLQAMQAENRDPTPAEWQALDDQVKNLLDQLNSKDQTG